ncbi:amphi-Trp domain-containing protein [Candidatus Uabimicrobium amorphum]|uniref:Amphi-Trp domain-containing protein n=1 Tax=Uabimicrobium amorphum TaxID=2596890 RepID=A0A5S9ILX9_UABAM|nr:amphi-Trp domain-containing protein [Candidatus Uabimicrobium amorphum]BBM84323.1 hypothetical protein UABAM_02680 [Candidatus Uabimicrobium amorphum]
MGKSWNFKSPVNKQELSNILRDLANSIEQGKVVLENEDSFVSCELDDSLTLRVEAEQKKDREKLSFEISWYKQSVKKIHEFKISSTEPEVTDE